MVVAVAFAVAVLVVVVVVSVKASTNAALSHYCRVQWPRHSTQIRYRRLAHGTFGFRCILVIWVVFVVVVVVVAVSVVVFVVGFVVILVVGFAYGGTFWQI